MTPLEIRLIRALRNAINAADNEHRKHPDSWSNSKASGLDEERTLLEGLE
jgi:hypothetical protein